MRSMSTGCDKCGGEGESAPVCVPLTQSVTQASTPPLDAVALTALRPGQIAYVRHTNLEAGDAELLRAMGLRMSARIRLCRLGEPCIVEVFSGGESCNRKGGCVCRIGLARPLADQVLVETVEAG
jgi:hypothetical protein